MCLGIPGRVTEIFTEHGLRAGKVDFSGICKCVCLEHVPEARVGDYVLVHVGFALATIDDIAAQRTFAFLQEMRQLDELQG